MSQLSSLETTPTPPKMPLSPALRLALGSLDVQLDTELERYRLAAKKAQTLPSLSTSSSPPVSIVEGQVETPPTPEELPLELQAPDSATPEAALPGTTPNTNLASTQTELPPPEDVSGEDHLDSIPNVATSDELPPQDYLESSERLLDRTVEPASDRSEKKGITPLGVGSILLFLAASATLGYVLVNPKSLNRLGLDDLLNRETASELESESEAETPNPELAEEAPSVGRVPRLPESPDLAAEEFVELDLQTLSSLDPDGKAAIPSQPPASAASNPQPPSPAPSAAANSENTNTLDNISELLTPKSNEPDVENEGEPAENATADTADDAQTDRADENRPQPPIDRDENYYGYYFVVVNYNGNVETFDLVREVVPDAYLREFPNGTKVQVGAFDDSPTAESLVDVLEQQGISAEVYRPQ
ncbi:MAG: hypothetical protein J7641_24100 [Cyanobacteria bacterium SID2]|nr:hypothetical protein [Cyanobacteria bacterium SID2]MBP0003589.1 hypothetical protein [Cyanobacteria bacterium SBC]